MKPLFILITFLATIIAQTSFATGKDVSPAVEKSFQNSFASATDVSWSTGDNMYKVRFVLNAQVVNAYYSLDGGLLAVTRHITSQQLPLALSTTLKKTYRNTWISELFELSNDEGTAYFVTLETGDSKTVLKSQGQSWVVFSKSKKD